MMLKSRQSYTLFCQQSRCIICCLLVILLSFTADAAWGQDLHTPRYYVSHAEAYIRSNAWNEAKRVIDEGLSHYADDPELRYMNGQFYYVTGYMNQARYNLVRAIQNDDQHFRAKRLLVDVEDKTEHYSSAICYVNELLEFQPYDRDLWRRKIGLYRKLGDDVEADAALARLARIYPNDSVVQNEQYRRSRQNFNQLMQKNRHADATEQLEQWIEAHPDHKENYIELFGLYQQMGELDHALATCDRALARFPDDAELVRRKVGLLTEQGRFVEALAFARRYGVGSSVYRDVMRATADASRLNDPYDQHARLYAQTGDADALTYLLNTSLTRGYYDDARYYLSESMRKQGRTTSLLTKQYALEKRSGNEQASWKLLRELYEKNPDDEELTADYAALLIELANRDISVEQWLDASESLQRALDILPIDSEVWPATMSKQITCLGRMSKYAEARRQYNRAAALDPANQSRYASAYEDIVGNHLRFLIQDEEYASAFEEAQALLQLLPQSETALRCCINMSETLHYDDLFLRYARRGYEAYPDVPYFIVKQAIALQREGRYDDAVALVHPRLHNQEYVNPMLLAARSGISQDYALELLRAHMPEAALAVVDSALVFDGKNRELLYTKGLVCEHLKDFGNAYTLQKRNYVPSNAEQQEFYQHTRWLHFRSFRNRVDANYTRAVYDTRENALGSTAHLYSIASVAYSRVARRNTYTGEVSYKGLDGYHADGDSVSGGTGIQLMGQWEHSFNDRWTGMISAAWSNQYFNKYSANISASYACDHGWTPSLRLGYRRTPPTYIFMSQAAQPSLDKYHLFIVTPSVEKAWERIRTTLSVDVSAMKSSIYYNVGLKGKLFVNDDNISSVSLLCGFGSFPELNFFEQTALRNLSHTNSMVGFDAQYLLTDHFYLGLAGSWNTCFSPVRAGGVLVDSYRNIYSLTLQLHMAF